MHSSIRLITHILTSMRVETQLCRNLLSVIAIPAGTKGGDAVKLCIASMSQVCRTVACSAGDDSGWSGLPTRYFRLTATPEIVPEPLAMNCAGRARLVRTSSRRRGVPLAGRRRARGSGIAACQAAETCNHACNQSWWCGKESPRRRSVGSRALTKANMPRWFAAFGIRKCSFDQGARRFRETVIPSVVRGSKPIQRRGDAAYHHMEGAGNRQHGGGRTMVIEVTGRRACIPSGNRRRWRGGTNHSGSCSLNALARRWDAANRRWQ